VNFGCAIHTQIGQPAGNQFESALVIAGCALIGPRVVRKKSCWRQLANAQLRQRNL
jgi:hypothetical protein